MPRAGSIGAWWAWIRPPAAPPACCRVKAEGDPHPGNRATPRQHRPDEGLGRSRGGLTCKIHLAGEGGRRPLGLLSSPGQWADSPQLIPVLERIRVPRPLGGHPRTRPDRVSGDKAYSSRRNRGYLRRRHIKHTIPEPKDQRVNRQRRGSRGGRPAGFDKESTNAATKSSGPSTRSKNFRAVATRYDKRLRRPRNRHGGRYTPLAPPLIADRP
jgi:Transposase DDE domain